MSDAEDVVYDTGHTHWLTASVHINHDINQHKQSVHYVAALPTGLEIRVNAAYTDFIANFKIFDLDEAYFKCNREYKFLHCMTQSQLDKTNHNFININNVYC